MSVSGSFPVGGRITWRYAVVSAQLRNGGDGELSYTWSCSGNHRGQEGQRTAVARKVKGVCKLIVVEAFARSKWLQFARRGIRPRSECREKGVNGPVVRCRCSMTPSRRDQASRTAETFATPVLGCPQPWDTSMPALKPNARTTQGDTGFNLRYLARLRLVFRGSHMHARLEMAIGVLV
ncbi:hypothetical protein CC86DRAFT_382075 [Ophiobolus disseminans]|uniref:Uncharacterized protein n=1 Tax=Ophiobolus disseminans TaxID=1469910 RepID=A0A6A7A1Q4_9PLEO|nr:hypothetical protein CC86DRAFT_382075 [Ophiobolus disseminans]